MRNFKKLVCIFCLSFLCFSMISCSKEKIEEKKNDNSEISEKYDEILKESIGDTPVGSDASVLGEGFSVNDFTFTSADNTLAFSLDKNSFVKLLPGGTFYNYITPGGEVTSYDAGYKTSKGLSLLNTAGEYIDKYKIADTDALYVNSENGHFYNPTDGKFAGRLTVLYGSVDSLYFKILTDDEVEKYLYKMNEKSDGTYINTKDITDLFPDFASVAALNITADESGTVSEVSVYRFDK